MKHKIKIFFLGLILLISNFYIVPKKTYAQTSCNPTATIESVCKATGGIWNLDTTDGIFKCDCSNAKPIEIQTPKSSAQCGLNEHYDSNLDGCIPDLGPTAHGVNPTTNPLDKVQSPSATVPPKSSAECPAGTDYINGICVPNLGFSSGLASTRNFGDFVTMVIKWILWLVGIVAVMAIMLGGFWWMTAAGNDEQAEKGKKTLTNAVIGMIVIILAYAIVSIISSTITSAPPSTNPFIKGGSSSGN